MPHRHYNTGGHQHYSTIQPALNRSTHCITINRRLILFSYAVYTYFWEKPRHHTHSRRHFVYRRHKVVLFSEFWLSSFFLCSGFGMQVHVPLGVRKGACIILKGRLPAFCSLCGLRNISTQLSSDFFAQFSAATLSPYQRSSSSAAASHSIQQLSSLSNWCLCVADS